MKSRRTLIGFVLALSLAVHALLPFFAHYSDSAKPSHLASLFGDKVLICTSEGFTWVKTEDLEKGNVPAKQHAKYFCPLCYTSANGMGKLLLASLPLAILPGAAHSAPEPAPAQFADATFENQFLSRAPPA